MMIDIIETLSAKLPRQRQGRSFWPSVVTCSLLIWPTGVEGRRRWWPPIRWRTLRRQQAHRCSEPASDWFIITTNTTII